MDQHKFSENKFNDTEEEFNDDIDDAWSKFCEDDMCSFSERPLANAKKEAAPTSTEFIPKCSALNISTKTKICYLNTTIDLKDVFWRIPLVKYHDPMIGVVKKQMKFNSDTPEEVAEIMKHKEKYDYVDDYILNQVQATKGRNKFKDIRKISIGICRKDITSYRCKKKSAFYNCFVVILRLFHNDVYKEINVKVFNTGKLGISGIQDALILNKVLDLLVTILTPIIKVGAAPLAYMNEQSETVMINSNFSCGYYINREKMYKLLKYKYKINSNFDSCSYPGIQCEFYYNTSEKTEQQTGVQPPVLSGKVGAPVKVSFMIFRTGSVLIVGKCTEEMLYDIYNFLCVIFETEYDSIKCANLADTSAEMVVKEKGRKLRKKMVMV